MSSLFSRIAAVIADQTKVPGWCVVPKAFALAATVLALRPKVSVEIGVFGGSSFFPMALAHKETGVGTVIGIDAWSNVAASEGYTGEHLEWWGKKVDLEKVRRDFMQQIVELGVSEYVKIHHAKSDDVTPPDVIDLLHVDGQHSDQAIRDVERFASRVRSGGVCFMDDINWEHGGVLRAVAKLKSIGFIELYRVDTGAAFQRIS